MNRILIMNYEFPPLGGGAGNASYHIAKHLAEAGHSVAVLTSSFRGLKDREKIHSFEVFRVPVIRQRMDRCSVFEMLSFMLSAFFFSPHIVKKFRPDIVIAFFGIPSGPIALWLKYIFKIPYILSLRGGDVPGFWPESLRAYHMLTKPLIRLVWKHSSIIVTNSQRLRKLAKSFSPGSRITITPNGIDTSLFRPVEQGSDKKSVKLLTTGRLSTQKRVNDLLKAFSILKKRGVSGNCNLEIVGDGPLRKRLEILSKNLQVNDIVSFTGWVSREDIPRKYQSADIFILPSLDEGMSNVILEAMASGLPIIATRSINNDGLIIDGHNGFLVPPKDPDSLCEKILALYSNKKLRVSMGQNNLRIINSLYGWHEVAKKYSEFLYYIPCSSKR